MPLAWFAAVVVVTTIMIVLTRRRARLNSAPSGIRRPVSERARQAREYSRTEDELREVIIELEQLARELNAQIDTKYRKLEAVIRHADQRIATLRELTGASDQTSPPSAGALDRTPARLDIVVGDEVEERPASPCSSPPAGGIDRKRILDLAAAGFTPAQIAADTHRSPGEVELVVRLHGTPGQGIPSIAP